MSIKIFLTGGTGFIGSHFINYAMKRGVEIIALRRHGSNPRIPIYQEPKWIIGSIDADLKECFKGVNVLLHLASHSTNFPYDNLDNCMYWNVTAPIRLAERAAAQGVSKFIITGTCFEYGESANRIHELDVDSPLEPNNNYSISKAASSIAFLGMARKMSIQLSLNRIFQVYGDGENKSRLWPALKYAAECGADFEMSKGEQVRDFIPVEKVVEVLFKAVEDRLLENNNIIIKHIATGVPQRTIDFATHWWEKWGANGKIVPGVIPYRNGEIMRIASSINAI